MFPRRILASAALSLFVVSSLAVQPAHAAVYVYGCVLNPRQEVPPVAAASLGGGRFVIDTDANTVTYRITYAGLSSVESAAHIHGFAAPGAPGGVLTPLPAGNPKVSVWTYLESEEASILAGLTYVNIHTATNGGGELRGQIVPFNALLDAAQETPTNATTGKGWATATVDTAANTISYYVFYEGLSGAVISSHLHGPALHGASAGVKVNLTASASPMTGTAPYLPADEAALLSGRMYVNLHTVLNSGGEIRGQLVPVVLPIDNGQEVPATTATGSAGFAMVAVDTLANSLSFDERIVALSGAEAAAHIHGFVPPTANGGVVFAQLLGARKIGTWVYGATNEDNVRDGLSYFNVHTAANGGGEIRGRIIGLPIAIPPPPPDLVAPTMDVATPNGAEVLNVGNGSSITWTAADNIGVTAVDLELSRAGVGGPYESIASGLANTGTFAWLVTGPTTTHAVVRATAHDAAGHTTQDLSNAEFSIADAAGVNDGPVTEFALSPVWPNPVHSSTRIQFALPRDANVHIGVYDLQGRQSLLLGHGVFAAGRHSLDLSSAASARLDPGLYFIRLTVPGRSLARRFVLMR
jgi:hypothetical protein